MLARVFAVLVLLFALGIPAAAQEVIRDFESEVTVQADGSVSVVETITVNALGREISRGIFRDIPVRLDGERGVRIRPELTVLSVTRNGAPEDFALENIGDFERIRIGAAERLLARGVHTYVIAYTLTRMVRPFEARDELYWNATGNYWAFPIERARARITLPGNAPAIEVTGYTGAFGSSEQAIDVSSDPTGATVIEATRPLGAGEGLTVAVAFEKGLVAFPQGSDAAGLWVADRLGIIVPLVALLIAVGYNALAWSKVGRDPERGTIIPLFHPPKGFSPALAHYVANWGFKNAGWPALSAAIFDLGVKGLVTIENQDDILTVRATGKAPAEPLPKGEQVLFGYFSQAGEVEIGKLSGPELEKQRGLFVAAIEKENRGRWFRNNAAFSVLGVLLGIGLIVAMVALDLLAPEWLVIAIGVGALLGVGIGFLTGLTRKFQLGKLLGLIWVGFIGLTVFGSMALEALSVGIDMAAFATLAIVAVTFVFAFLMRAPTLQGRKIMDEIEGFKLYLETAEKDRLNINAEPPLTVERFERILPYAIALGVEKPWSEHFEAELSRHAVPDAGLDYSPRWYGGQSWTRGGIGGFSNSISAATSGMTAAMIAAQPVQASSSGFSSGGGGGGFSGGGGGGGGGGGW